MRHDFLVKTPQAAGITHEAKRNRSTGRPDLDISKKKIPIEMARSVLTFFDNKPPQMAGITHEAKRNPPTPPESVCLDAAEFTRGRFHLALQYSV